MEEKKNNSEKEFSLENIITTAIKVPGIKVSRHDFLKSTFSKEQSLIDTILDVGPVEAGVDRDQLARSASRLIWTRTTESSAISFGLGVPGGAAMAATVPADIMQFFGTALRLAQELSYLYGAPDLWEDGEIDDERVRNQLILYCGVMFGVSGASAGVRVLSTRIARVAGEKLPQKALTKTFWYPILKKIGKVIGVKITKDSVAKGVSKIVPVIGGVVSGGLNFASMMPMAKRLQAVLDKSSFNYSEEELEADYIELDSLDMEDEPKEKANLSETEVGLVKDAKEKVSGFVGNLFKNRKEQETKATAQTEKEDILAIIHQLKEYQEEGIITEEEFNEKKKELLARI